jgi:exonuclease SbcC
MRLRELRFQGVGLPFARGEVAIDFEALGPGLIAVVGGNGEGKSHVLELSGYGTIFREFASYRESLASHVAAGIRDARTQLSFTLHEHEYRVLVQIDPQANAGRGKTEAYLSCDGRAIAGPGVREVDIEIARLLPSKQWWLSSVFAAQSTAASRTGSSFWALDRAARKDLFVELLGLEHLQSYSVAARDRAQAELLRLERVRSDIARERDALERHTHLTAEIEEAGQAVEQIEVRCAATAVQADAAAAVATATQEALARADKVREDVRQEQQRLTATITTTSADRDEVRARLASLDALLAERETIEQATRRLPEIDTELDALRELESTYQERTTPLIAAIARYKAEAAGCRESIERDRILRPVAARAQQQLPSLEALLAEAGQRRVRGAEITARLTEIELERPARQEWAKKERDCVEEARRLRDRQRDLIARKGLLGQIPGVPECAACPLTADARMAVEHLAGVEAELAEWDKQDAGGAQGELEALLAEQGQLNTERGELDAWLTERAPALAGIEATRQTAGTLDEIDRRIAQGSTAAGLLDSRLEETRIEIEHYEANAGVLTDRRSFLQEERRVVAGLAKHAAALAGAQAQAQELETRHDRLSEEISAAELACGALVLTPGLVGEGAYTDLVNDARHRTAESSVAAEQRVEIAAERQAKEIEIANLNGRRDALGDPATELGRLISDERALAQRVADWTLLERACGRDGVQALEIDAAGPTVTALANDLLSSCFSGRFQLAIETTARSKDGKKQKEVFDVRILDGALGRTEGTLGSGGEMVLLDEALRLALALFNAAKSGFRCETLWRDETAGQLSPANAQQYVTMLRRAMAVGGFHQCLFISHAPEVWEQADARLFVEGGAVRPG